MSDSVSREDSSMAPTKAVGLRLAPDVVEWLKARAKEEERSPAFLVTRLIRQQMAREAKPKKAKTARS
jgi:hypothetical protein